MVAPSHAKSSAEGEIFSLILRAFLKLPHAGNATAKWASLCTWIVTAPLS